MYNNGDAKSIQYIFNESLQKWQKILPSCISLNTEHMWGAILEAILFVILYRRNFGGSRLYSLSSCCLDIWGFPDEVFGIDPIWEKYTFFLPTLYGSASKIIPKQLINFLHSVIFTIKMGSWFSLFSVTRL